MPNLATRTTESCVPTISFCIRSMSLVLLGHPLMMAVSNGLCWLRKSTHIMISLVGTAPGPKYKASNAPKALHDRRSTSGVRVMRTSSDAALVPSQLSQT